MNFEAFKRGGGFARDEHAVAMLISFALIALAVRSFVTGGAPGEWLLPYVVLGALRLGREGLARMIDPYGLQLPLALGVILAWPYVGWAQRQARW